MQQSRLNATFAALADPTRRAILARLATGDASVTELARPFAMSQPAVSKHLKVLERAGVMTRVFDAARALVFDAHTKPELVKRWLLGPPGWSMPVCEIDLRVGGKYRYVWRHNTKGTQMGMGGVYREIVAPERIVSTERFDEAWYPGEAVGTLLLVERGG